MPLIKGKQIADASITQAKLNLIDPTSALEAATKQYVDNAAGGKIGGTIADGEVAFGDGSDAIAGSPSLTFNDSTKTLSVLDSTAADSISISVAVGQVVNIASTIPVRFGSEAQSMSKFTVLDGAGKQSEYKESEVLLGNYSGDPTVPKLSAYPALNIESAGEIQVNGLSGNAGQVLTSNGTGASPTWQDASVGIGGTIAANEIAFGTGADTIGGDSRLTWDAGTGDLAVTDSGSANTIKLHTSPWPLIESTDSMNINVANFAGTIALQTGGVDLVYIGGDDGDGGKYLQSQNTVRIESRGPLVVTDFDGLNVSTLRAQDNAKNLAPLNLEITALQLNTDAGSAGQVLTSNGFGVAPTWEDVAATAYTAGDGLQLIGNEFSVGNYSITQVMLNLATPTSSAEAATKGYVDGLVNGTSWKAPVEAVETATNIILSGAPKTIDGQSIASGKRVLLTAQSNPINNGIWVVASGAWTRPDDFAVGDSASNAACFVKIGNTYADTSWVCTTNTAVIGTNGLTFVQFGSGATYTAGDGLQLIGTEFSIDASADSSVLANGGGLHAATLTTYNKDMTPNATTGNGQASGMQISATPAGNGMVHVFINGLRVYLAQDKLGDCYFSGDSGATARSFGDIAPGDELYWNGVIAGYDLDSGDRATFIYDLIQ